jgi:hypothetical protein
VHLLEREGQKQRADDDRQRDDRPPPRATDDAVEEDQDRTEDVDQRLEDVGEDHDRVDRAVGFGHQVPGRRAVPAGNSRSLHSYCSA